MPPKNKTSLDEEALKQIQLIVQNVIAPLETKLNQALTKMDSIETELRDFKVSQKKLQSTVKNNTENIKAFNSSFTQMQSYILNITKKLAMYVLDMDNHSRKWSLIIQGIQGPAAEPEANTRSKCLELAKKIGISYNSAANLHLAACHRLSQSENAGIIIRFTDLRDRDLWLTKARNLRPKDKISISPDLPPKLRQLKTEVLNTRKSLSSDDKKRSKVRHLTSWPYVQLTVGDTKQHCKTTQDEIIKDLLDIGDFPLPSFIDPTLDTEEYPLPPTVNPDIPNDPDSNNSSIIE